MTRPHARMVTAEFLFAILVAIIALFYTDDTYQAKMRTFVIQLSGISAVYFIIAMLGVSEKAARVGVMFGLLIDLSIVMHVFKTKKTSTPSTVEATTEASPYWTTDPNGVAQGNTANATPNNGAGEGSITNATPTPGSGSGSTAVAASGKPTLKRALVNVPQAV